jgi:hypothetical protein
VGLVVDALNAKDPDVNQNEVTGAKPDVAPPPDYEVSGESSMGIWSFEISIYVFNALKMACD